MFKVTPTGVLSTLVSFGGIHGARPQAGLVESPDGRFYGTTSGNGSDSGTVFQVTPEGVLTTLASFTEANLNVNGMFPSSLVWGPDGNVYGTTSLGGSGGGHGTVFKVTPNGVLTSLVSFMNSTYGSHPGAELVLGHDGNFYGTTSDGGSSDSGTLFKVTGNGVFTT